MPIEFVGLAAVQEEMARRLAAISDLTPDLLLARDEFGAVEAEKFASGQGFRPDSPGTQVYRAQEGMAGPTMVRSGQLKNALSRPTVFAQSATSIRAGTDLKQGFFHQFGFTQKWYVAGVAGRYYLARRAGYQQAPRQPIDLSAADRLRIAAAFIRSFMGRLR